MKKREVEGGGGGGKNIKGVRIEVKVEVIYFSRRSR